MKREVKERIKRNKLKRNLTARKRHYLRIAEAIHYFLSLPRAWP